MSVQRRSYRKRCHSRKSRSRPWDSIRSTKLKVLAIHGAVFLFHGSDFAKVGPYAFHGGCLLHGGSVFVDGRFPAEFLDRTQKKTAAATAA
jgi:hypothetical protein